MIIKKTINTSLCALLITLLSGCGGGSKWIVECEGGFSSGVSFKTQISDGVIFWIKEKGGVRHHRKMIDGEICTDTRVFEKDTEETS